MRESRAKPHGDKGFAPTSSFRPVSPVTASRGLPKPRVAGSSPSSASRESPGNPRLSSSQWRGGRPFRSPLVAQRSERPPSLPRTRPAAGVRPRRSIRAGGHRCARASSRWFPRSGRRRSAGCRRRAPKRCPSAAARKASRSRRSRQRPAPTRTRGDGSYAGRSGLRGSGEAEAGIEPRRELVGCARAT